MRNERPLRLGVVLLLAAILAILGSVAFARRLSTAEPRLGVEWLGTGSGPLALSVDPGGPAARAGLRAGDVLVTVDGHPVRVSIHDVNLPWIASDRAARIEVRRDGAQIALHLRSHLADDAPDLYGYLSLVGLAFLVSGVFVALRWPNIRGGHVYALLGLSLFTLLVMSHTGNAQPFDWIVFALDVLAGAIAPALLIHLGVALSRRGVPAPRLAVALAYALAVSLLVLAAWAVGLRGAVRLRDPGRAVLALDRLELLFMGFAVIAAAALMTRSYVRSSSATHRSQIRWMLWGLSIGLAPVTLLYVIPWSLGAHVPTWAQFLSVLPLLVVPPAFTAALVRYRLHDLSLILRRGLVEVTAAFCTLAVYAVAVVVLRWVGEGGILPLGRNGARYLAILPAALTSLQLRAWMKTGIDRAFFRKRYSYRTTLLDWARELNLETDLGSLLERLRQRVLETLGLPESRVLVRVEACQFEAAVGPERVVRLDLDARMMDRLEKEPYVAVEEGALEALPWARYLFGMRVKGRVRAVLAAAERPGMDEPLTTEDRSLLATLAAHAATAIEAARLVHEVRQQAEQVGRLQARQEKILESSGVGLLLADGEGRILAWNRALEEIYGMPRAQALGRRIAEIFPLHLVRRIDRALDDIGASRDETTGRDEVKIYRQALVNRVGSRIVVNLSISPAGQDERADGARVVTFDDVTERIRLEEQVSRQERLASLGMLAAGVAHEINTPLTGISSYTQMLLEDVSRDDPRHQVLEKIEAQTRRVSGIANSLLNLARPERAPFEDLSLNEAVREVLQLFESEVRALGIRVTSSLDAALPALRGHKGKLQQVLLNLLMNARDAVGEGGKIAVATYRREDRAVLEVTDDGVGIPEDDLPRIFDPFFTTKGRGKGTGLGLSISYGIVREHDGDMSVESVPGEATRFRVELPLVRTARAMA